jgi:hypothetical protein
MTIIEARRRASQSLEASRAAGADVAEGARDLADGARAAGSQARAAVEGAIDHLPDVIDAARSGAAQLTDGLPGAMDRARTSAQDTTSTLQSMPDPTLRILVAASLGFAAGLYLTGAPRLVTLAAIAPAAIVAVAILSRPETVRRHGR